MNKPLEGRIALIGGGSKGLGFGCACQLANAGAGIIICSRNESNLKTATEKLKSYDVPVHYIVADMSNPIDNTKILSEVKEKYDRLDILVNNSGGAAAGKYREISEDQWLDNFGSVLMYNIRMTSGAIELMKQNNWGRIINITSLSVKEPAESLVVSNVFRAGVIAFAKSISKEIIRHNITINNLCPGAFKTDRAIELIKKTAESNQMTEEMVESENKAKMPLGRYQEPQELGSLVAYLCSELAGGITGTTIQVDGGISNSLF